MPAQKEIVIKLSILLIYYSFCFRGHAFSRNEIKD